MPNKQQRRDIDIFPPPGQRRRSPSSLRRPSSWGPPLTDRRHRRRPDVAPRRPSPTRRPARRTPAKEDEAPPPSYRTHAPAHTRHDPSRVYDFHRRDRATHTHIPTPDPPRIYDFHRRDRSTTTHQPTPRPPIPYTQRPDPRFPPAPSSEPLTLHDSDGYAAHSLHLLSPASPTLPALLATAAARFAAHDRIRAEDLVETAVRTGVLRHVSDGPRGGIWVVERGREDVVAGVVEMGEGGWGVLGVGCGGSEGRVFLGHACGWGGEGEGVVEVEGRGRGKGKEEGVEVGGWGGRKGKDGVGVVVGREKGMQEEGRGRKKDGVMGLVERILGRVKREVEADELVGWVMEKVR